jgi:hypothetical protein
VSSQLPTQRPSNDWSFFELKYKPYVSQNVDEYVLCSFTKSFLSIEAHSTWFIRDVSYISEGGQRKTLLRS